MTQMKTKKTEIANRVMKKKYTGDDGRVYEFSITTTPYNSDDDESNKTKKIIVDEKFIETVQGMASLQIPKKYIAHVLGVDRKAFEKLFNKVEVIKNAYKKGIATGVANISKIAYKLATDKDKPNVQLIIKYLEKFGILDSLKEERNTSGDYNDISNEARLSSMSLKERLTKFAEYNKMIDVTELKDRSEEIQEKEKKMEKILSIKDST